MIEKFEFIRFFWLVHRICLNIFNTIRLDLKTGYSEILKRPNYFENLIFWLTITNFMTTRSLARVPAHCTLAYPGTPGTSGNHRHLRRHHRRHRCSHLRRRYVTTCVVKLRTGNKLVGKRLSAVGQRELPSDTFSVPFLLLRRSSRLIKLQLVLDCMWVDITFSFSICTKNTILINANNIQFISTSSTAIQRIFLCNCNQTMNMLITLTCTSIYFQTIILFTTMQ